MLRMAALVFLAGCMMTPGTGGYRGGGGAVPSGGGASSGGGGGLGEETLTSDYHRAHPGTIAFSSAPIQMGREDPSTFRTSFKLGDPLFARVYLKHSISRSIRNPNKANDWALHITADGGVIDLSHELGSDPQFFAALVEDSDKTSIDFTFTRDAKLDVHDDDVLSFHIKWFLALASRLSPGPHKIDISLIGVEHKAGDFVTTTVITTEPGAVGGFVLDVPADRDRVIARLRKREADQQADIEAAGAESRSERPAAAADSQPASEDGERTVHAGHAEPAEPAEPACRPEGATADSQNDCCSGRARKRHRADTTVVCCALSSASCEDGN